MSCIFSISVSSSILQVKVSLDSLIESLNSLLDTGDCVSRVELLLKELKTLEEKAQVSQTHKAHTKCYPVIIPLLITIMH